MAKSKEGFRAMQAAKEALDLAEERCCADDTPETMEAVVSAKLQYRSARTRYYGKA